MISLLLSIVFTVVLFLFFKEFERRDINTHHAITVNYINACILDLILFIIKT